MKRIFFHEIWIIFLFYFLTVTPVLDIMKIFVIRVFRIIYNFNINRTTTKMTHKPVYLNFMYFCALNPKTIIKRRRQSNFSRFNPVSVQFTFLFLEILISHFSNFFPIFFFEMYRNVCILFKLFLIFDKFWSFHFKIEIY